MWMAPESHMCRSFTTHNWPVSSVLRLTAVGWRAEPGITPGAGPGGRVGRIGAARYPGSPCR